MTTSYLTRFGDAMERLCGGSRPNDELLRSWLDFKRGDDSLQEFAVEHGPAWAQGIVVIEAAQLLADTPEEGVMHCYPNEHACSCGDPDPYHGA